MCSCRCICYRLKLYTRYLLYGDDDCVNIKKDVNNNIANNSNVKDTFIFFDLYFDTLLYKNPFYFIIIFKSVLLVNIFKVCTFS